MLWIPLLRVTTESHLTSQIFDTLVVYNDITEKWNRIAHTWELSADGLMDVLFTKRYTFS